MRIGPNLFFEESVRSAFSSEKMHRSCFFMALALAAAFIFWWPIGPLIFDIPSDGGPRTFLAVAVALCLCSAYIGARSSAEDYSPAAGARIREWVLLTPVSLKALVAGKVGFAVLHTLFLLALGAPFLLASLAVSGISADRAMAALLVAGAFTFALRTAGLFLLVLLGVRKVLRSTILFTVSALFLSATFPFAPAANPVVAVAGLSAADPPPSNLVFGIWIPNFLTSVMIDLIAAIALAFATYAVLAAVRSTKAREQSG
jgi:hypothetical protein